MLHKHLLISVVCLFVFIINGFCLAVDSEPIGWATLGGGTTGGEGGEVVTVTTKADFVSAVSGDTARIVQVVGTIHGDSNIPNVGSNKTILGIGYDAKIVGFSVKVTDLDNVIVRNITFTGAMPQDGIICRRATHVWIDHCTFYNAADGQLDFSDQCDYSTVSWCKFYYTGKVNEHQLACLVGSTDDNADDVGKLNITWHHNWWGQNCDQRMPRVRYGQEHIFNNYYTCTGNYYCIGGSWGFKGLVEKNYFDHVNNPMMDAGRTDSGDSGTFTTEIKSVGNIFNECTGSRTTYGNAFVPGYLYTPDEAADIPSIVEEGAGPTILVGDSSLWPVKATIPTPITGEFNASTDTTLKWMAGYEAVSHDVYFGTSPMSLVSYGNQSGTSFTPPPLLSDTQYYWRVDEVADDDSVTTGDVWTFKTGAVLSSNLLHYWPFDVDFLDVAKVLSNPNNPFGAAWMDSEEQILGGGCLDLTLGKDGLIPGWSESSTNTIFPSAAPMTVSLWFKPTALPASDSTACVLGTKPGSETSAKYFRVEFLPNGGCGLRIDDDSPEFGNMATMNAWNHVLVSIDSSGQLRAWLNADDTGSITLTTAASNNYNGQYAGIGFYGDTPNGLHRGDYNGYVDDVAIWSVSSGLEFAELLYNDGAGKSVTGPAFVGEQISLDTVEMSDCSSQSLGDYAYDLNGNSLTFSKDSGPVWLGVASDGTLLGIPDNDDVGQNDFSFRVTDDNGACDTAAVTINVENVYSGTQGMEDLVGLVNEWLDDSCGLCGGSDLNDDDGVTVDDFAILSKRWKADETLMMSLQLDETTGTVASDESLYGRDGTLLNGPVWLSGYIDGALEFDGVDDYVKVTGYKGISGGASRTCTAWIKTSVADKEVITWGTKSAGQKWIVKLNTTTGELYVNIGGGYICGSTVLTDDAWHHIAVVVDDDSSADISEVLLYVDGVAEVISDSSEKLIDTGFDQKVAIGVYPSGAGYYFDGLMDDVRVYDRALSESEIQGIAQ